MAFEKYVQIHCFRIKDYRKETEILREACSAGGFPEYRLDRVDIFIPEGPGLTGFLLRYQEGLERLEFMDYRVAKYTK